MAYGNKKFESNGTLVFFSPRSKDKEGNKVKPYFTVSKVVDKKIVTQSYTVDFVSGDLIKVEVKSRTSEKFGTTKEVKLYLKDTSNNEVGVVSLPFRMSTRSLFNALSGLKAFGNVEISIYQTKKGYEAFYLTQAGGKVEWAHELSELPEPPVVKFKGKDMRDYTPVDDFFEKEMVALASRISGKTEQVVQETANTVVDQDVPF